MASMFLEQAVLMMVIVVTMRMVATSKMTADTPPHIIFIVADDLGWNDVEWRNPNMRTPNLKRLMEQGILLNNSYMQPYCTPSRAAILSGLYPYHTGLQHHVIQWRQAAGLPEHLTILPQALKRRGYATHAVGKWHLGFCKWAYTPTERGFDSFLGFYGGVENFYTHDYLGGYDFRLNRQVLDLTGIYSTNVFTERTIQILNEHNRSQPLFIYLSFQAVHIPLQVPREYQKRCSHIKYRNRRVFCGMAAAMDESVGSVMDTLEGLGYTDNLLLVFTSDNGGSVPENGGSNLPLRGHKGTLWEGGQRVPGFLYSKNLFKPGKRVHDGLVHAVDWFPTLMTAASAEDELPSGLDGVSQWEAITQDGKSPRNEFVYNIDHINQNAAIRMGDYKLIQGDPDKRCSRPREPRPSDYMLFNVRDDPLERTDIKNDNPKLLEEMKTRLERWRKSEVPANFNYEHLFDADPSNFNGVWSPGWC